MTTEADKNTKYFTDTPENENWADNSSCSKSEKIKAINDYKKSLQETIEFENELISIMKEKSADKDKKRIYYLFKKLGIHQKKEKHIALTKAEKKIIRMDFYGTINTPGNNSLSKHYLEQKNNENKPVYDIKEYNLDKCQSWSLFKQFPSFRKIENTIKHRLRDMGINPNCIKPISREDKKLLKKHNVLLFNINKLTDDEKNKLIEAGVSKECFEKLSVEDFADVIHDRFKTREDASASVFLGARNRFVKDVVNKFEKQIRCALEEKNVHPKYVEALIETMRSKGICEVPGVMDENGNEIKGPRFSVHHKHPVKDASSLEYLAEANLFSNFCLFMDTDDKFSIHQGVFHADGFDRTYIDKGENIQETIQFDDPNVVFAWGLRPDQRMSYNYSEDERTIRASRNIRQVEAGEFITNEENMEKRKEKKNSPNQETIKHNKQIDALNLRMKKLQRN